MWKAGCQWSLLVLSRLGPIAHLRSPTVVRACCCAVARGTSLTTARRLLHLLHPHLWQVPCWASGAAVEVPQIVVLGLTPAFGEP